MYKRYLAEKLWKYHHISNNVFEKAQYWYLKT